MEVTVVQQISGIAVGTAEPEISEGHGRAAFAPSELRQDRNLVATDFV
jgi:hypothetical protein